MNFFNDAQVIKIWSWEVQVPNHTAENIDLVYQMSDFVTNIQTHRLQSKESWVCASVKTSIR